MTRPPRVSHPDSTLPLLADPYRYVSRQARESGSDILRGRFLLRPCTFLLGRQAAELFYDTDLFQRAGAMPKPVLKTLLGEGGVQGMDGEAHRHRKAMFIDALMSTERVEDLRDRTERAWREATRRWAGRRVVLYEEVQELLMRAVCDWADVTLPEGDVKKRTRQVSLLFDAAGAKNLRHVAAIFARRRAEKWLEAEIEAVRGGGRIPRTQSALHQLAWFRDEGGQLLPARNAAVGLLNVIRPVVAISVYVVLAAHALHEHPAHVPAEGDDLATEHFAQEVRRFYPFFPAVMAIAKREVSYRGFRIPKGERVVLDLHATNHERGRWGDPQTFRPGRFEAWDRDPFDFVPHGGGGHATGHRCPGERITVTLMKQAIQVLAHRLRHRVPGDQDLTLDLRRIPALPKSRFELEAAEWVADAAEPVEPLERTRPRSPDALSEHSGA